MVGGEKNMIVGYRVIVLMMGLVGIGMIGKGGIMMFGEGEQWKDVGEGFMKENVIVDGRRGNMIC